MILVADNLRITLPAIGRAVERLDPEPIRQNMAVLEVIRTLPDLLGFPVRTIAGLSNLTTGAPDPSTRRRYQGAFLPMLVAAGVSMILLNVLDPTIIRVAGLSQRIAGKTVFSWQ